MEYVLAICGGLALASACGFRVFLPLLMLSAAANLHIFSLSSSVDWLATWPALVVLATAAIVELIAFYVPWLDHALDAAASPLAVAAGTIMMLAVLPAGTPPWVKWLLAIVAGGGHAGGFHAATMAVRGVSTATTAGLGNSVVATVEAALSVVLTVLAIVAPLVAIVLVLALLIVMIKLGRRLVGLFIRRPVEGPAPVMAA